MRSTIDHWRLPGCVSYLLVQRRRLAAKKMWITMTDMDGNNNGTEVYPSVTEYDFEVRKLYNALHGSGNLVRWML